MSDQLEKVSGITRLPLFPLAVVLLPNEMLPLHIFEPRYRQMLKDVALDANMFGVSYFSPPEDFIDKPAAGSVGCVAEVRESQVMPDGRANILTVGGARYRVLDYIDAGEPYLVGDVEFFEDEAQDEMILNPLADEVFKLFRRVALAAHKLSGERGTVPDVQQTEPEALSFLVTAAFNLEPDLKYQLLETRSTIERLERLKKILLQTVGKMEDSAEINKVAKTNGHSKKKVDF